MKSQKNIIPIFRWAVANAEAIVIDRVLIRIMPQLLNSGVKLTSKGIESSEDIEVDEAVYSLIKETTEEIVGSSYHEEKNV